MPGPCQHSQADARGEGRECRSAWPDARRLVLLTARTPIAPGEYNADFLERIDAQSRRALVAGPAVRVGAETAPADIRADAFHADGATPGMDAAAAAIAVAGGAVRRSLCEL